MERLRPLKDEIRAFAAAGNPLLGICLGQQLLFDVSEEMGEHVGLGLVPGRVRYLPGGPGLKVPHMGWSALTPAAKADVCKEVHKGEQVYFVHSLYTSCDDLADVAATAEHGIQFPAAVQRDNVWGVQFHPEKSGDVGLRILKSFVEC
jgi:imidazole glycerol-phosphate synthase subunit HisH